MLLMQRVTGASRAGESDSGSHWRPFHDSNGVSGHAFMGAVLLLFSWVKRPRTLLIWAIALFVLPLPFFGLVYALLVFIQNQPEFAAQFEAELAGGAMPFDVEQALAVYRDGTFWEITAQRWNDLATLEQQGPRA